MEPDCTVVISPVARAAHPHNSALQLHSGCLSAKSVLFRGLFSAPASLDLCAPPLQPPRVPRSRLPRLLPSPPSHPVVFLPVPDPSSIQPLFHWMYFGNTDHIEHALDRGDIQWEGLARNVEYLGLSTDIKVFLGRWYRNWFLCAPGVAPCPTDEDEESDDHDSDHSDDENSECSRGRTRDVTPLVQLCGRLRLSTTG